MVFPHCIFFFLIIFIYFTYLFLAALGLHCLVWSFSGCDEWVLAFTAAYWLPVTLTSLVVEHRL